MKTCQWTEDEIPCDNLVEGRTDYCATHGHMIRKAAKQAAKVKVVTPVKKITAKRAKQNSEYLVMREQFLEQYPVCQVKDCQNKATEIHHMKSRANENLLDQENFLAVCPECHHKITVYSSWAISQGYSKLRSI